MIMKKLLIKIKNNKDGSSIISVLVAFIILLLGIAGFLTAIMTTGGLVTRASNLNTATAKVTEQFYQGYQSQQSFTGEEEGTAGYVINFQEDGGSGTAFFLRGSAQTMELQADITKEDADGNQTTETIDYNMYYFK